MTLLTFNLNIKDGYGMREKYANQHSFAKAVVSLKLGPGILIWIFESDTLGLNGYTCE